MCAIKYILGFCCYKLITLADTGGYYLIPPPHGNQNLREVK